jgi:hypothetical protein
MERIVMRPKTVAQKLLIRSGATIWSSHADRLALLGALPEDVRLVSRPQGAQVALVFTDDEPSLRATLDQQQAALHAASTLWVAYPKGNRIAINRDRLWPILTEYGLRPIGQVAIDPVWSALRFRPLQPGEAPFTGGR